ncbi:hypothetical protein [Actinomyces qiguomingii]|uniref:hypothetical protein n=1 Tax=Actinomyces qiguomingii TaxID=2057800 RepID=UPI000CA05B17|nr:hypothetical protein [Actinomyces qiguomingii]
MTPAPGSPTKEVDGLEPAAALAVIGEQTSAYRHLIEIRSAPLYTACGLAWLIGYGVCGLNVRADYTLASGPFLVFLGCLAAAAVFTCVYIARRSRGLYGRTAWVGTIQGLAWMGGLILAFTISGRLGAFLRELGTPEAFDMISILSNALPCLVVGVMFLAGAAIWEEIPMAVTGGWILVVTTAATVVGGHALWAIMALAGGGGLLMAGAASVLLDRRQSSSAGA